MIRIQIRRRASAFAEDKDLAAVIREKDLKPAIDRGERVRFDFDGVEGATQSFVHAMLSEVIRTQGAGVLDRIEFTNCNPPVRSVIEIVAEYSQLKQDDFPAEQAGAPTGQPKPVKRKRIGKKASTDKA